MSAPASRRGLILGLATVPLLGGVALASTAADPHVARLPQALALWRHHKATEWGWEQPYDSPADREASDAHHAVLHFVEDGLRLPPPTSAVGLGAFALTVALAHERHFTGERDELDTACVAGLLLGVLATTGTTLPDGFDGLYYKAEGSV